MKLKTVDKIKNIHFHINLSTIGMRGGVTAPFLGLFENFGFLKKMINLVETNVFGAPMMPNVVFRQFWLFLTIFAIFDHFLQFLVKSRAN